MNTTDGFWIPSYYRRRHPFLWVRAAGGPQTIDWLAGVALAGLVLLLIALARAPHHQATPSPVVVVTTVSQDRDSNSDRVAYVPRAASVGK